MICDFVSFCTLMMEARCSFETRRHGVTSHRIVISMILPICLSICLIYSNAVGLCIYLNESSRSANSEYVDWIFLAQSKSTGDMLTAFDKAVLFQKNLIISLLDLIIVDGILQCQKRYFTEFTILLHPSAVRNRCVFFLFWQTLNSSNNIDIS
jgi:hypothetical protein